MAEKTYDELVGQVRVAYIGNKPVKQDTIARTGVVWDGFGDVQVVDARAASLLLAHKTVWIKESELPAFKAAMEKSLTAEMETAGANVSAPVVQDAPAAGGDAPDNDVAGAVVGDEAKTEAIQKAILALDSENPDHFTGGGKPRVEAVRVLLPDMEISSVEVNAAFKDLGGE